MAEKGFDCKRSEPFSVSEIRTFVFSFFVRYNQSNKHKGASIWKQFLKILAVVIHNKVIIFCPILRHLLKTKGKSAFGEWDTNDIWNQIIECFITIFLHKVSSTITFPMLSVKQKIYLNR